MRSQSGRFGLELYSINETQSKSLFCLISNLKVFE
jgi:hypothetical protein